jgi:hypothetical protein
MNVHLKISHRIAAATAGTLALAIALSACGSASPRSTVANLGSTTTAATSGSSSGAPSTPQARFEQALKFSSCMRSHGLPNFPDPQRHGNGATLMLRSGQGINPSSSQFQAATRACRQYAPAGATGGTVSPAFRAQALAFAACMRSHGVPNFPDPQFQAGGVRIGGPGFDFNSPQFKSAQTACQSKLPGGPGGAVSTQEGGGGK